MVFWRKASNGQMHVAFLLGKEVGDGWDMDPPVMSGWAGTTVLIKVSASLSSKRRCLNGCYGRCVGTQEANCSSSPHFLLVAGSGPLNATS